MGKEERERKYWYLSENFLMLKHDCYVVGFVGLDYGFSVNLSWVNFHGQTRFVNHNTRWASLSINAL